MDDFNKDGIDGEARHSPEEKEKVRLFDDAELPVGELAPPPGSLEAPRRYIPWQKILLEGVRMIAAITAFAAIFYMLGSYRRADYDNGDADITVAAEPGTPPETAAPEGSGTAAGTGDLSAGTESEPDELIILNESGGAVDISGIGDDGYVLSPLAAPAESIRVIIIHSHTSERVSESEGVAAAGERLAAMLNTAGIPTYHCADRQDRNGVIGAYSNMKATLSGLLDDYPDTVCVIDLHCSDTESPLTLTVGCSTVTGWRENLLFAAAVCREASEVSPCLRLLTGTLGQDSGVLSLHAGIGGAAYTPQEAAAALDTLYEAIVAVSGSG